MNSLNKVLILAAAAMSFIPTVEAGNLTPEKERMARQPLRFRHARPRTEGLYGVPGPRKMSKVPVIKSTVGRPKLVANSTSGRVGQGYGMYSFFAESNLSLEKIADTPPFFGGAVYVNGKYYAADYDYNDAYELDYVEWYVYDATTWRREKVVENPLDYTYIATDRTYDATTGKVYSITYDRTGNAIQLSTTSLTDGASTLVAPLTKNVIMIAASPTGQLYGIDTEANLYRINKSTAELTLVGNTNIYDDYLSEYTQSITFDPESGKILWAEFHSEGLFTSVSSLYEVDPATAATVKIADLPGSPEMIGMYVTDYLQSGVPAAVSNLTVVPVSEGSLECNVTFKAPSVTTDGSVLSDALTIELTVDGDLMDIKEVTPGSEVNCGPFSLTRGLHTVKVVAENSVGAGAVAARVFFAGYDVPGAPRSVTMTYENGNATLTWLAPLEGAEGGAMRGPLKYNVVRMPGEKVVAAETTSTTFTEPLEEAGLYYYIVTPVSPDGEGTPAESNSLVAGSCGLPFITSFDTQNDFDLWTVVDVASGGKVWNYDEENHRLRHPWSIDNAIDDYIISPGLKMDGSKTYNVSFDAYQMVAGYDEHVMLYFGSSQDVSKMKLILDTEKLGETAANFEGTVAPSETGIWYIAFRSKTGRNGFMSYVDNVRVMEKGSSAVAAGVSNFKAQAADEGKLEVTLSFDAPKVSMQGSALTSISHIDIMRGEGAEPIKVIEAATPGEHISWTDTSVKRGIHTYRVVVYTAEGAGEPVSSRVFAGVDVPESPVDFRATGSEGARELTWKAPAQGQNGGNLNGLLSYKLVRMVNDKAEVIDDNLKELSYTDTWSTKEQAFVYYTLTAVTTAGESESVNTSSFAVGEAYELPYSESFADAKPQTNPWSIEQVAGAQGEWAINKSGENPYVSAQDGDGGIATFDGYHGWTDGCELRLISPTIGIDKYKDVVLSFYLYHYNGSAGWWQEDPDPVGETLIVEVSENGGAFKAIPAANYTLYNSTSGWKKYEISLDDYRKEGGVRVAFRGRGAGNFNIHIDNIHIDGTFVGSGVETVVSGDAYAAGAKGEILFHALSGEVCIYDMSGRMVAKADGSSAGVTVNPGVYAVVCGKSVFKVIVK